MQIPKKIIKSPLNYSGNKYLLIKKIFPFFPDEVENFVDLFGGTGVVAANANAKNIIYNEYDYNIYNIIKMFITTEPDIFQKQIDERIENFKLTKYNSKGYENLKETYNKNPNYLDLYLLSCYSFSNIIRFNSEIKFNVPFGSRQFSSIMRTNIPLFFQSFQNKNAKLFTLDFAEVEIPNNSFVYIDPPYLGTGAIYNERDGWRVLEENRMYSFIEELIKKDIKFAISNDLSRNKLILEWAEKNNLNIIDIEHSYKNAFYQKKPTEETKEVLIINY
jgi:DNA adenine methylase Dam